MDHRINSAVYVQVLSEPIKSLLRSPISLLGLTPNKNFMGSPSTLIIYSKELIL